MYIHDILNRIKLDWREWRSYDKLVHKLKRELKLTRKAIRHAEFENAKNGKTYYIYPDIYGNPAAFTRKDFLLQKKYGLTDKSKTSIDEYKSCLAIVTSSKFIRNQFIEHQLKDVKCPECGNVVFLNKPKTDE